MMNNGKSPSYNANSKIRNTHYAKLSLWLLEGERGI